MRVRAIAAVTTALLVSRCELITRPGEVHFVDGSTIRDARNDAHDAGFDTSIATDGSTDGFPADIQAADAPCTMAMCGTSCVDLQSDPMHCGTCAVACGGGPDAIAACRGGACTLACSAGFANCNGVDADGCESSLASVGSCGACGRVCPAAPNASARCGAGGTCGITCVAGWGDCNGNAADGCEQPLNALSHCGACGVTCPAAGPNQAYSCVAGTCSPYCTGDGLDCNGIAADGCETTYLSSTSCGGCGTRCGGSSTCMQTSSGTGTGCCYDTGSTNVCSGTTCSSLEYCENIGGHIYCCI